MLRKDPQLLTRRPNALAPEPVRLGLSFPLSFTA